MRSDSVRNANVRPVVQAVANQSPRSFLPDEDCSGPPASRQLRVTLVFFFGISARGVCSLRTVDNGRPVRTRANYGRGIGATFVSLFGARVSSLEIN